MVYSSKQNPLIKEINALKDKKYRNKFGLYIAEGVKMVNEAISLGVEVVTVVATTSVINQIKSGSYKLMEVTDDVFSYLSDEATPQGAREDRHSVGRRRFAVRSFDGQGKHPVSHFRRTVARSPRTVPQGTRTDRRPSRRLCSHGRSVEL